MKGVIWTTIHAILIHGSLLALPVLSQSADLPKSDRRDLYKVPEDDLYRSPIQLTVTGDGRRLYVTCEGTDQLLVVDPNRKKVIAEVGVGRRPWGGELSADERTI